MDQVRWGRTGTAQRIFRANFFLVSNVNFLHQILYQTILCDSVTTVTGSNTFVKTHRTHTTKMLGDDGTSRQDADREEDSVWQGCWWVGGGGGGGGAGYLGNLPAQRCSKPWRLHMRRATVRLWRETGRSPDRSPGGDTAPVLHGVTFGRWTMCLLFLMTTENL